MKVKRLLSQLKLTPKDEKVDFNLDSIFQGHFNVTYRGINAIKCPFDYVILQMIVFEVKPNLIIEIGSSSGGSALYLADLLTLFGIDGKVHAIDINENAKLNVGEHPRIKFFTEGWENYSLAQAEHFDKVLIIEDASHSYDCTMGVMNKFAHLVSRDSYFIIEDGIVDALGKSLDFGGGPLKAIREFLPNNPDFFVDRKWCNMFGTNATFNVNGYLKRR